MQAAEATAVDLLGRAEGAAADSVAQGRGAKGACVRAAHSTAVLCDPEPPSSTPAVPGGKKEPREEEDALKGLGFLLNSAGASCMPSRSQFFICVK